MALKPLPPEGVSSPLIAAQASSALSPPAAEEESLPHIPSAAVP